MIKTTGESLAFREVPATEMQSGDQIRANHNGCVAGEDKKQRLYVKKDGKAFLYYCHHCGQGAYLAGSRMETRVTMGNPMPDSSGARRYLESALGSWDEITPDELKYLTNHLSGRRTAGFLPPMAVGFYNPRKVTRTKIYNRLIVPITGIDVRTGVYKVAGFNFRAYEALRGSVVPKNIRVNVNDEDHGEILDFYGLRSDCRLQTRADLDHFVPLCYGPHDPLRDGTKGSILVITEDWLSAYTVLDAVAGVTGEPFSELPFNAMPLHGTSFKTHYMQAALKYKDIYVMLDSDSAGSNAAVDIVRDLTLFVDDPRAVHNIMLPAKSPKDMESKAIEKYLPKYIEKHLSYGKGS